MSAVNASLDESYVLSPIHRWYINMFENTISGYIRKANLTYDTFETGYIYSYTDKHVMAKFGCKLYAIVLKDTSPCHEHRRCEYINYLRNLGVNPHVTI